MHPTTLATRLSVYEPELSRLEAAIAYAQGRIVADEQLAQRYLANGWGALPQGRDWQAEHDRLLARHGIVLAIVEGLQAIPPVEVADPEVVKFQAAYERGLAREAAAPLHRALDKMAAE